jgi:hypothetical protein
VPQPQPAPSPPPLLPLIPPPVDHPAYLGQPAMNPAQPAPATPAAGAMPAPDEPDPAVVRAREFLSKRVKGKDLKRAVERVRKLRWLEHLYDAKAASAASGKPILWIQSLGDIDGFA